MEVHSLPLISVSVTDSGTHFPVCFCAFELRQQELPGQFASGHALYSLFSDIIIVACERFGDRSLSLVPLWISLPTWSIELRLKKKNPWSKRMIKSKFCRYNKRIDSWAVSEAKPLFWMTVLISIILDIFPWLKTMCKCNRLGFQKETVWFLWLEIQVLFWHLPWALHNRLQGLHIL